MTPKPARRSAITSLFCKTTKKNSTLPAAHSVSTHRITKKKNEPSTLGVAEPMVTMVIEDGPAGLRFLDILERLSEEQSAKSQAAS